MTNWWPYLRLAAAALGIAALVRQISQTIGNAQVSTTEWGSHIPTVVANFFSYFTVLSNIGAAVSLIIGAIWMLRTRDSTQAEPRWLAVLFACTSTYMIVTGIVYNLLLRNIPLDGVSEWWTNETMHVLIPLVMLADVFFAPRRRALGWSAVTIAAIFPIVWAAYTLIRASFITAPLTGDPWWFPYPFLNWHVIGFGAVSLYIVGIAVAIIGVASLVVLVGRRRGIRSA